MKPTNNPRGLPARFRGLNTNVDVDTYVRRLKRPNITNSYTRNQLADKLDVTYTTIERWQKKGLIKSHQEDADMGILGGTHWFPHAYVTKVFEKCQVTKTRPLTDKQLLARSLPLNTLVEELKRRRDAGEL